MLGSGVGYICVYAGLVSFVRHHKPFLLEICTKPDKIFLKMVVFIHALRGFRSSFSRYGEKETADDVQRHPLFVYIDVVKLQTCVRWLQVQ